MDGDARMMMKFANGTSATELLVTNDKALRRLVYAVVGRRVVQHSSSVEVLSDGSGGTIVVWTTDVLPNALAPYIESEMDEAALVMNVFLKLGGPSRSLPDQRLSENSRNIERKNCDAASQNQHRCGYGSGLSRVCNGSNRASRTPIEPRAACHEREFNQG